MLQYDIGLDANGDLDLSTGDLSVVKSDQQHIRDIVNSFAGYWRNFPYVGVGIFQYLMDNSTDQALVQNIKTQLTADGYVINTVIPVRTAGSLLQIKTDAKRP